MCYYCNWQLNIRGYDGIGRHARFRFSCREACRFDPCYPHHVVASFVSLATTFYALHQKPSRAHSAAPPSRIKPACGWALIRFFSTIINILHQCYTSHTIPPSKTFPSHILTGLYFFYRMYYHFHIRGFYALWLCGAFGKIPVFNDRLIKRDKTNEKSNCSAVVYMHNISGMCRRGKSI